MNSLDRNQKKELEKILEKERKTLIAIGEKLVNKTDKRILLQKALKSWIELPKFLKDKIKQKNNYIKDYLEKEYLDIAKNYQKDEEIKAKWDNLGVDRGAING
ncbi:hypothetical protein [Psychrilyobacter sp.]|uniref:hypothetical protein n=1 Tax=Psychrilyobacter sp. TaxID=2586924 RepID=UPI0030159776